MSIKVLAKRYLDAYINCFEDKNKKQAYSDLKLYVEKISTNDEFVSLLINPCISFDDKSSLIKNIVESKKLIITNFLLLLISKGRSEIIKILTPLIEESILELNNCLLAKVYSPIDLSDKEFDAIESFLKGKFDKNISFVFEKDKSILAGVKIEVNNKLFDATLNSSLQKLKLAYK